MLFKCVSWFNKKECLNLRLFSGCGIHVACAIVLWLGLTYVSVREAQANPAQPPIILPAFQENFWDITLNERDLKKTLLFLRDANRKVLISGDDLQRLQLRQPETTPLLHHGEAFYPLDDLGGVVYHVDEATQTIAINVPGDVFMPNTLSATKTSPTPVPSSLGGFINYDGFVQYNQGKAELRGLTELGVFSSWGVGTTTLLGKNLMQAPQVIRLDSTWIKDMPSSMSTFRFGDTISRPGEWGGAARFGGIQWSTNFATQPLFIPFPMAAVAGEAVLPSTVDVYVNNTLQTRTEVPAGPFSITNVPVLTGQGEALIVVKDLLGREQLITQPFYVAPQLLSRGTHSYSYEAGFIRQNYGLASFDYGRVLMAGTHRDGINEQLTVEVHGEVLRQQQTLGISGNYLWPALGVFSLTLGGSHSDAGSGPFTAIGFQRQSRWFNIAARTRLAGKDFTQLGVRPETPVPREVSNVSIGINFGRYGTFSLGYVRQDNREKLDVEVARAGYNISFGRLGVLNMGYFKSLSGVPNEGASLTYTFALGDRTSASLHGISQNGNEQATAQLQRNLPRGSGIGYRLLAAQGNNDRYAAALNMQNNVGLYTAEVAHFNEQTGFRGSMSGGVAIMGIQPHFSRRINNSFVLVQAPGLPNARVYADNQLAGVTNAKGNVLIPQLRPYQRNPIRIEHEDIPFGAQYNKLEQDVVPYFRSGYALNFAVKSSRGAVLNLILDNGNPMPVGAVVQIKGQDEEFPVAMRGEVFVTGLETNNDLRVTYRGQSCEFTVAFPETEDPLPNLGTYKCSGVTP